MEGSEPAPNLLTGLLLADIHRELVAHGKLTILHAEAICLLSIQGLKPAEIQKHIGITADEYRKAHGWLLEAITRAVDFPPMSGSAQNHVHGRRTGDDETVVG